MNVTGQRQAVGIPLVNVVAVLSADTRVTVEVDNFATALFARIGSTYDAYDLCVRCRDAYGHHPKVYEIEMVSDYEGGRLLLRCV